ncbi:cob(I)yrinic acid a,c-diamide adenosyltransferase [candidate division GN15 bacterium]|nr:cob(I)yrinic acid a,c-diamide adenosyltransferase [candidate division GN15 bacterium]
MTSTKRHIQIYTGNGKGKTTAAIGQAIRAAGSRLKTLIVMFMKDYPYGEVRALKNFSDYITIERYGNDKFVFEKKPPGDKDIATAHKALARAREAMLSGEYDMVILDEVCVCVYFKLLTADDVLPILDDKPDNVELVLTGRYCPKEWLDRADLVTEMTEVKHYYQQGVLSRKGFES